ncbi:MAG: M3 family oligoendopeptidase [Planctomycetaceae bacterium]|nr:M3 family oligoendopeptidase [Planctomycetaceae bacterium]
MPHPQIWDLDSLYPNPQSDEFQAVWDEFLSRLKTLSADSEALPAISTDSEVVETWTQFLVQWSEVRAQYSELSSFAGCHAAGDAGNTEYRKLEARLSSLSPLRAKINSAIEFALQPCTAEEFEAFVAQDDRLQEVSFYLAERKQMADLRLSKELELLASELSVDGFSAWGRLYDRLSGDLRVPIQEKGELVEKSPGQVQFDDPSREIRQNKFYAASKAWDTIADTCADALNHLSGTRLTIYSRVGVDDHLDMPLAQNRMQRETLEAMWSEISAFQPTLKKYLDRKAKLLGLDRLAWYDLQAPLPQKYLGQVDPVINYDAACDLIAESFDEFSPDLGEFARMSYEKAWIEAESRAGKRQGGFCTGFDLKKESRIFMTYNNTADSMSTLAHELGHAYHSWVLKEEPLLQQDYPMNLAETASTFAEAVLGEYRLKTADEQTQLAILEGMLGDSVSFLMNIHCRFLFEDAFHRERPQGELSADRFSELMQNAQQTAYQGALSDDGWYPGFWISKLHFYITGVPFYNFPYTFGYLLSLGVYALADEYGDEFPERYRQLLINTGCCSAEEAVQKTFDRDLRGPEFWRKSLQIVETRLNRFLELSENL